MLRFKKNLGFTWGFVWGSVGVFRWEMYGIALRCALRGVLALTP